MATMNQNLLEMLIFLKLRSKLLTLKKSGQELKSVRRDNATHVTKQTEIRKIFPKIICFNRIGS
jgi:hypothetical protein